MGIHIKFAAFLFFCGLLMLVSASANAYTYQNCWNSNGETAKSPTTGKATLYVPDMKDTMAGSSFGFGGFSSSKSDSAAGSTSLYVPSTKNYAITDTVGMGGVNLGAGSYASLSKTVSGSISNPAGTYFNKLPGISGIPSGVNIPGVGDYASLGKKLYNQIPGSADFSSMVDSEYLQDLAEINSEIDKGIAQAMGAVNEAKTAALTAVNDAKAAAMKQAQQAYESAYTAAKEEAESVAASLAGEIPGIDAAEFIDDGIDEMNITPADFDVTKLKLPTIDPMKIVQAKANALKRQALNEAKGYLGGALKKVQGQAVSYATDAGKSAFGSVKSSIGF